MQSIWKRQLSLVLAASLAFASWPLAAAAAAPAAPGLQLVVPGRPAAVPSQMKRSAAGQVIVKFRPHASAKLASNSMAAAVSSGGGVVVHEDKQSRMLVQLPNDPAKAASLVAALRGMPDVAYVETNNTMKAFGTAPNDTRYPELWGLTRLNAPAAWAALPANAGSVVVAVVDSGVDSTHPDLKDRVLPGFNAIDSTTNSMDDHGHGTHVSGTIAAVYNNSLGITGVAGPAAVRILPVKVLDANGSGDVYTVARGIEWAADNGANIINLSLGGSHSDIIRDAVLYAQSQGVVVVAAAGNETADTVNVSPADVPGVVTVAALDQGDTAASFSNFGDQVDVIAPGVGILSTVPGGGYAAWAGTSMATPHVVGVAALVKAAHPQYSRWDIQACIYATVAPIAQTGKYGRGVPQADAAVACDSSLLDSSYALKLEAPDPDTAVFGTTPFTFDAKAGGARIIITDSTGAERGSAQYTGEGLVTVNTDLSSLAIGPTTLTATLSDAGGVVIATHPFPVMVGQDPTTITIKTYDENNNPAAALVQLFRKEQHHYSDAVYTWWEPVGGAMSDSTGTLKLSGAEFPEGSDFLAVAVQETGTSRVIRQGTVRSPGNLALNGGLVEARVSYDQSLTGGDLYLAAKSPELEVTGPPIWVGSQAETGKRLLVSAGNYRATLSDSATYLLPQDLNLQGDAASVAFDLSNTTTLTWAADPARQYGDVQLVLREPGSNYGFSLGLPNTLSQTPITVKKGTYEPDFQLGVADGSAGSWFYNLTGQPVTVTSPVVLREGNLSTARSYGSESALPGTIWHAQYDYETSSGFSLFWATRTTGKLQSAAAMHKGVAVVAVPGRAPTAWLIGTGGNAATMLPQLDSGPPSAQLRVLNASGQQVNGASNTDAGFSFSDWQIPATQPGGAYKATVALDAGPLGTATGSQPLTVQSDAVTDGLRLRVTGEDGTPVAGAAVSVIRKFTADGKSSYVPAYTRINTDADGYVRLTGSMLPPGAAVKVVVANEGTAPWTVIKDVTLPYNGTVTPANLEQVTVSARTLTDQPLDGTAGWFGLAAVDGDGTSFYSGMLGTGDASGTATIRLSPGAYRFTALDGANLGYFISDRVSVPAVTTVAIKHDGLVQLALGDVQAPDGGAMAPGEVWATAPGFPADLLLAYQGERLTWHVTPGTFIHAGDYDRTVGPNDLWRYTIVGRVAAVQSTQIAVGGAFSAQIQPPVKAAANTYRFFTGFNDSHGNALTDISTEDPAWGFAAANAAALKRADYAAVQSHQRLAQLHDMLLRRELGPDLSEQAGMGALSLQGLAPSLVIRETAGTERWRNQDWVNWLWAPFYAPNDFHGDYVAEVSVPTGPEGSISATVPFRVDSVGLALSTTQFNPGKEKLKITTALPAKAKYTMTVRDSDGKTVKTLASNQSYGGAVLWDGKGSTGRLVPNGSYQIQVITPAGEEAIAGFTLRLPPTPVMPALTIQKPLTNVPAAQTAGKVNANFRVEARVKAPGGADFTSVGIVATARADGGFSAPISLANGDGTYEFQIRGVDPDDNTNVSRWTASAKLHLDTTLPVVQLTAPSPVNGVVLTNQNRLTLAGTTEPGARVTALAGTDARSATRTATADTRGVWRIDGLALQGGANSLSLSAVDPAGNLSETKQFAVTVDTIAPVLTADTLVLTAGDAALRPTVSRGTYSFTTRAAPQYVLSGTFSEPVGRAVPSTGKLVPAIAGNSFSVDVTAALRSGSNALSLDVYDLAGNKSRVYAVIVLDAVKPMVTVVEKDRVFAPQPAPVTFTVNAAEPLSALRVVSGNDRPLDGVTITTSASTDARKWTVKATFPADDATWALQFVGVDLAGNTGEADVRARRQVIIDGTSPSLFLTNTTDSVIFTTSGSLTVSGSVSDTGSGVKNVTVGKTVLTPNQAGVFSTKVALTEGKLTAIAVVVQDFAGNRSTQTIQVLMKSKVNLVTVNTPSRLTQRQLTITGKTDAPIVLSDGRTVAVIPVTVLVTDSLKVARLYQATVQPDGSYSVSIDAADWPKGRCSIKVTAGVPAEFAGPGTTFKSNTATGTVTMN